MKNYNTAWKYCSDLYDMEVCAVRAKHIKNCMFNGTIELSNGNVQMPSVTAQSNIKLLWGMMLDYAVEHDIISHNYARDFKMPNVGIMYEPGATMPAELRYWRKVTRLEVKYVSTDKERRKLQ